MRREAWRIGWGETVEALRQWSARPRQILPWVLISLALSAGLLLAVLVIGSRTEAGPFSGVLFAADPRDRPIDVVTVVVRNMLVLALHLLVCLASYLAQRSLPLQGERLGGWRGTLHTRATVPALVAVYGLTAIALVQQATVLGAALADTSAASGEAPGVILLRLLPHATPELVAVFLPLSAAVWLGIRRRPEQLLAATLLCTAVGTPVLVLSALLEIYVADRFFV